MIKATQLLFIVLVFYLSLNADDSVSKINTLKIHLKGEAKTFYKQAEALKQEDKVFISKLIKALASSDRKVRHKASKAFEKLSPTFELALYIQLKDTKDPELQLYVRTVYKKYVFIDKYKDVVIPEMILPHFVDPMETVKSIALMYESKVEWIMKANNFKNEGDLHKFSEIKVPVEPRIIHE